MVKHLAIGNGKLLINIDEWLQTRDIYYPHVGQENHLLGKVHKIGLFYDNKLTWLYEKSWVKKLKYIPETLTTENKANNNEFELTINDLIHYKENIYLKKISIYNKTQADKELTLYFYQDFKIYGDGLGDTAAYDPSINAIFHYKRNRYFLVNCMLQKSINNNELYGDLHEYCIGQEEGKIIEDAYDNKLELKPIAQGKVDSIFSIKLFLKARKTEELCYWIAIGQKYDEVAKLNLHLIRKKPKKIIQETNNYWKKWLKQNKTSLKNLDPKVTTLYKRSLLLIKTQIDTEGAILAANDSDNQQFNHDTYSYMWPRDGAITAIALQKAGFTEDTKNFYKFCNKVITQAGFFLHKYNPDGSLGSSWHPYFENGKPQLPIQEDETALVTISLWNHYQQSKDKKFLKENYPMMKKMGEFLSTFRSKKTGLPRESYDLWEERRGILCFTCNTVCAALEAASNAAKELKDNINHEKFLKAHKEVHKAVQKNLWSEEHGQFLRMIQYKNKKKIIDATLESSLYSNFYYCGFDVNDTKIRKTMNKIIKNLWIKTEVGGMPRYKYDRYYSQTEDWENVPGNPWFVCTLWLAKYYIKKKDFEEAKKLLQWVADKALSTGVLAEQIHPYTGKALSVSPLTWSHAEFVETVCDLQNEINN